jgi:Mg2+ and Co2+ transporter CorA
MTAALTPLQYVRPSAEPRVWSCYNDPNGQMRLDLSPEEIVRALAKGEGTLWVDIDTRDSAKVSMLGDIFHFHPLAIEEADEFMDSLEEKIFAQFDQGVLREVFAVKRLVLSLRRHLAPERDAMSILTNRPSTLLAPDTQIYFRDIYDHVLRIYDSLENFRDLLSSTQESYLTQVSNRLGMATKALGVVATVTLPFVVVSGMWGMNFEGIPLHSNPHGFMILVIAQLALGLVILAGLKWRKIL